MMAHEWMRKRCLASVGKKKHPRIRFKETARTCLNQVGAKSSGEGFPLRDGLAQTRTERLPLYNLTVRSLYIWPNRTLGTCLRQSPKHILSLTD